MQEDKVARFAAKLACQVRKVTCFDNQNSIAPFTDWNRFGWCRTAVFRGRAPTSRAATTAAQEMPRIALPMVPGQCAVIVGSLLWLHPPASAPHLHPADRRILDVVAAPIAKLVHRAVHLNECSGQREINRLAACRTQGNMHSQVWHGPNIRLHLQASPC